MKALITMNDYGFMADLNGIARVDSRFVAEAFGKQHKDVLRSIKRIIGVESGYSAEFTERNFAPSNYVDPTGRKLPCYLVTRDGFVVLAIGFTGKEADRFKEAYMRSTVNVINIYEPRSLCGYYSRATLELCQRHSETTPETLQRHLTTGESEIRL